MTSGGVGFDRNPNPRNMLDQLTKQPTNYGFKTQHVVSKPSFRYKLDLVGSDGACMHIKVDVLYWTLKFGLGEIVRVKTYFSPTSPSKVERDQVIRVSLVPH